MENIKLLNELTLIFRDVLENDDINLTETTTAKDVEEWDSLTHIQIIVGIEKKFKIKFGSMEILNWKNVGEMVHSIERKIS
jgi:acyl carrier protein